MKKIILTLVSILLTFNMLAQINTFKNASGKAFSVNGKQTSKTTTKWDMYLHFYEMKDKNLFISEVKLDKTGKELGYIITTKLPLSKIKKAKDSPELTKQTDTDGAFTPADSYRITFLSNETNVSNFTKTTFEIFEDDKKDVVEKVTFEMLPFNDEKQAKAFLDEFNKPATTTPKTGVKTKK